MKITIDKESLLKSINIADSVISVKNINTILSNCLLNVSENKIVIISTDNEIAIRTKIEAISDSSGSFTVNGKKFSNLLKELPSDELIIDINDSLIIDVKTKSKDIKGHFTLIGTTSDEYPEISEFQDENSVDIDQILLKEMIKKVVYAASNDSIKPIFNGLFFLSDPKGELTAVATDSRRLSMINRSVENSIDIGKGIIIPLKTVNEISRLLESAGTCKFSFSNNQFFIKIGDTEIISRIVEGQFPNYKQVIPVEQSLSAVIETKKLLDSVKRAMIFTREPANKIILNFNKSNLVIEASTPELGEAEEEILIESNSDESISLGVNAQFMIDSLKEVDTDKINCGLSGQMNPITITPVGDDNFVSVIMPIQIKSSDSD